MTLDELYEYITSQITPEEALKRFLSCSISHYDKLRKDPDEIGGHPLGIVTLAAADLGWIVGFKKDTEDAKVNGVFVGTEEFVDELMQDNPGMEDKYHIVKPTNNDGENNQY